VIVPDPAVVAALGRLKVFPLPQGVLLPGSGLPLHIFEPRYRELVRVALETDKVMAVARLAPGWEADYEGRPGLLPTAGAGLIEEAERLPDGRYNILVRGVARVQLGPELEAHQPYRELSAVLAPELPARSADHVDTVRRAVLQLTETLPKELAQMLAVAAARLGDPGLLCDVVAAAVFEDPATLQGVLEAFDVQQRLSLVLGEIGTLLLAARPPDALLQ